MCASEALVLLEPSGTCSASPGRHMTSSYMYSVYKYVDEKGPFVAALGPEFLAAAPRCWRTVDALWLLTSVLPQILFTDSQKAPTGADGEELYGERLQPDRPPNRPALCLLLDQDLRAPFFTWSLLLNQTRIARLILERRRPQVVNNEQKRPIGVMRSVTDLRPSGGGPVHQS